MQQSPKATTSAASPDNPGKSYPPGHDARIVRAAIHPAIGVARIGNSKDAYYIGPEVTDPGPTTYGGNRDSSGAILRQAARFRIYGYNAAGEIVGEIDANDANIDIEWRVHVANRKAAWYQFDRALDIPEAEGLTTTRRNPASSRRHDTHWLSTPAHAA